MTTLVDPPFTTILSVSLVDHMGDDNSVVNAARVSFEKESSAFTPEQNNKLIQFLAEHKHMLPFAHTSITLRCKAPIFLARQLGKHQVGMSWNEVSRRYVDSEPEFFVPELRKRAPNKKQGSLDETVDASEELLTYYKDTTLGCLATYEDLLQGGVAPEVARSVLPQNMMTEWIWTGSLLAFMRVYDLRIGSHAQKEAQVFAEALLPALESLFPVSVQALKGKQA